MIQPTVWCVSSGGGYAIFAGKEVARALAVMSLKDEDCSNDLAGLTDKQMNTLQEWEDKFKTKYEIVGKACFFLFKEVLDIYGRALPEQVPA